MSFEAMTWAVKQDLPAMQKLVLLLMANRHNNDTGLCMPSHDRLAKDCGMSKTALKSAIKSLAEKGLLSISHRAESGVSMSNLYRLNTEITYQATEQGVGRQTTHPVAKRPTQSADDIGRQTTGGGSPNDRGWVAKRPGVGRQTTTEPGSEPVIETGIETERARTSPRRARGTRIPDDWTLPADWKQWALAEQPTWTEQHCIKISLTFADYWRSLPGQKAVKCDWQATWRNWVRRENPMSTGSDRAAKPSRHQLKPASEFAALVKEDGSVDF